MALQRNLKALGTFGFQTTSRGNPVYIQYIPRTLELRARQPGARRRGSRRLRELLGRRICEELRLTCQHRDRPRAGVESPDGPLRHLHAPLSRAPADAASTWCTSPRTASRRSSCSPRARTSTTTTTQAVARAGGMARRHAARAALGARADRARRCSGGKWVGSFSNASRDESRPQGGAAGNRGGARAWPARFPYRYLVVHLGMPTTERVAASDNQPDAARRSVEEIVEKARARQRARGARGDPERAVERRRARAI